MLIPAQTTIETKRKEIEAVNTRTRKAIIKIKEQRVEEEDKKSRNRTGRKGKTRGKGTRKETEGKGRKSKVGRMRPKKIGNKNGEVETFRKGNTTATSGSRRP